MKKTVVRKINGKSFKLIDFRVYDKRPGDDSSDEGNNDHPIFVIQMFGINEKGQTCCIYVNNYQPFFYVKVAKTFDQNDCQELMMQIKEDMKFEYLKSCVLKAELVEKNKLYGFSGGNKDNFVKFTFQNQLTMNKVKGLWYNYYKDKDGNNQIDI